MNQTTTEFKIDETPLSLPEGISTTTLRDQFITLIKRRAELAEKLRETERQAERKKRRFLLALLEVVDAFDRIFRDTDLAELDDKARELVGVFRVTKAMLENVLDREDIISMEGLEGQHFDPRLQEVIGVEAQTDTLDGMVLEVRERGYYWGDNLLRPAKVIVSKKSESD